MKIWVCLTIFTTFVVFYLILRENVWNNEELYGCEYRTIRSTNELYFVQSTVIYIDDTTGNVHNVDYGIELD